MLADLYQQKKRCAANGGFHIDLAVTTAGTTQDVKAPKVTGLTLKLQKLKVIVVTGSAKTVQLRAKTTTTILFTPVLDLTTAGVIFSFDYGAEGVALPAGETLEASISAAGAAFRITGEGYYA